MADRAFRKEVGGLEEGVVALEGFFDIAADGTVTAATSRFKGASCARTANAGEYQITFEDFYRDLLAIKLQMQAATAVDLVPQVVSHTLKDAAGKTLLFKTLTGATPTTPSAVCRVYVDAKLSNSTVK